MSEGEFKQNGRCAQAALPPHHTRQKAQPCSRPNSPVHSLTPPSSFFPCLHHQGPLLQQQPPRLNHPSSRPCKPASTAIFSSAGYFGCGEFIKSLRRAIFERGGGRGSKIVLEDGNSGGRQVATCSTRPPLSPEPSSEEPQLHLHPPSLFHICISFLYLQIQIQIQGAGRHLLNTAKTQLHLYFSSVSYIWGHKYKYVCKYTYKYICKYKYKYVLEYKYNCK